MFDHQWNNPDNKICSKCKKTIDKNLYIFIKDESINLCDFCHYMLEADTEKCVRVFIGQWKELENGVITNDENIPKILNR